MFTTKSGASKEVIVRKVTKVKPKPKAKAKKC